MEDEEKGAILQQRLLERFQWQKVRAPQTWRPQKNGDQLVGFYGGKSVRKGYHGEYTVILVHLPKIGSYMVSGTGIIQLIDSTMVKPGHPICITWKGSKVFGKDAEGKNKTVKQFELAVAEGDPLGDEILVQLAGMVQ